MVSFIPSPVHIHLLLNHTPIFLVTLGLLLFLLNNVFKSTAIHRLFLGLLVLAAFSTLPVYFSGEGAEEAVEHLPTITKPIIETHEHSAKTTFILLELTGLLSLLTLVSHFKKPATEKFLLPLVVIVTLLATASAIETGGLGGKIRHTEIREARTTATISIPPAIPPDVDAD